MPRPDNCHVQVSQALIKDGWSVAHKSVFLTDKYRNDVYIDIDATHASNGTQSRQIFVEVKCFALPKETAEFHRAIGQYVIYRGVIQRAAIPAALYLAVPAASFDKYFNSYMLDVMANNMVKLLKIDMEQERILQWIE